MIKSHWLCYKCLTLKVFKEKCIITSDVLKYLITDDVNFTIAI